MPEAAYPGSIESTANDLLVNEEKLLHKLRLLEALHAGAATEGEKIAAGEARERILKRLAELTETDEPEEFQFSMADTWSRKVFVALLRRYNIQPYRYHRQRRTTVMARMPRRFMEETLWPEFQEFSKTLRDYLSEVTDRVVTQVLDGDSSDAEVVSEQLMLGN